MKVKKLKKDSKCESEYCNDDATRIVFDQLDNMVYLVCNKHAKECTRSFPEYEYLVKCPNCKCETPVG
jgi:hypothetical protein